MAKEYFKKTVLENDTLVYEGQFNFFAAGLLLTFKLIIQSVFTDKLVLIPEIRQFILLLGQIVCEGLEANFIYSDNEEKKHAVKNNQYIVNLILKSGLVPAVFKEQLLKNNSVKNIQLNAFKPLVSYNNRYYLIGWIFPENKNSSLVHHDQLIQDILRNGTYLHNVQDRTVLQLSSRYFRCNEKNVQFLNEYAAFCALNHPDAWLNLLKNIPQGLPKTLHLQNSQLFEFHVYSKSFLKKPSKDAANKIVSIISILNDRKQENQDRIELRTTLEILLISILTQLISNNCPSDYRDSSQIVLEAAALIWPVFYRRLALMEKSGILKTTGFIGKNYLTEAIKYEKEIKESQSPFLLLDALCAKTPADQLNPPPPIDKTYFHQYQYKHYGNRVLAWLEFHLVIQYETKNIPLEVLKKIYPQYQDPVEIEKMEKLQKGILNYRWDHPLYYDPGIIKNGESAPKPLQESAPEISQSVSRQESPYNATGLYPALYPEDEGDITREEFADQIKTAIDADDEQTIVRLHNRHFLLAFEDLEGRKSLIRINSSPDADFTPLDYATFSKKFSSLSGLLTAKYSLVESGLYSRVMSHILYSIHPIYYKLENDAQLLFKMLLGHSAFDLLKILEVPSKLSSEKPKSKYLIELFVERIAWCWPAEILYDEGKIHSVLSSTELDTFKLLLLMCFKIITQSSLDEKIYLNEKSIYFLSLLGLMMFSDAEGLKLHHVKVNSAKLNNPCSSNILAQTLMSENGLIEPAYKHKLNENNALHNLQMNAFLPVVSLTNQYHWVNLIFKNPQKFHTQIVNEILLSKSYMTNHQDLHVLHLFSKNLTSAQAIRDSLTHFSDFLALDNIHVWKLLPEIIPQDLPRHLDYIDSESFKIFSFTKWFGARYGIRQKNEAATLFDAIWIANSEMGKTVIVEMLQLVFLIFKQLNLPHFPQDYRIDCKDILVKMSQRWPEIHWLLALLYRGNKLIGTSLVRNQENYFFVYLKAFQNESLYGAANDFSKVFPAIHYVLTTRVSDKQTVQFPITDPFGNKNGYQFLLFIENHIILNYAEEYGISEQMIKQIYPQALDVVERARIATQQKTIIPFDLSEGLFYNPLLEDEDQQDFQQRFAPSAPLMSSIMSKLVTPAISRPCSPELGSNRQAPSLYFNNDDDEIVIRANDNSEVVQKVILKDEPKEEKSIEEPAENLENAVLVEEVQNLPIEPSADMKNDNFLLADKSTLEIEIVATQSFSQQTSINIEIDCPPVASHSLIDEPIRTPVAISTALQSREKHHSAIKFNLTKEETEEKVIQLSDAEKLASLNDLLRLQSSTLNFAISKMTNEIGDGTLVQTCLQSMNTIMAEKIRLEERMKAEESAQQLNVRLNSWPI